MFVAGAPDPGEDKPLGVGFWGRLATFVLPATIWEPNGLTHPPPEPGAWHLPGEMLMSIEIVEREAARLHLPVRIIDVNHSGTDRPLVDRYVGPDDLLPLVVRSDSGRLDGFESITPGAVRQFLSRH